MTSDASPVAYCLLPERPGWGTRAASDRPYKRVCCLLPERPERGNTDGRVPSLRAYLLPDQKYRFSRPSRALPCLASSQSKVTGKHHAAADQQGQNGDKVSQILLYDDSDEIKQANSCNHPTENTQKIAPTARIRVFEISKNSEKNDRQDKGCEAKNHKKDVSDRMPLFEFFVGLHQEKRRGALGGQPLVDKLALGGRAI